MTIPEGKTHLVFVFGTLKEGFPNYHGNTGLRMPGVFTTSQRYPLYLAGDRFSPWLINQPGKGAQVRGQVFRVDEAALARMDALERITEPDGYRRREISVSSPDGRDELRVFAYLKEPGHLSASQIRRGPLSEYTLAHAGLYRSREPANRAGAQPCPRGLKNLSWT